MKSLMIQRIFASLLYDLHRLYKTWYNHRESSLDYRKIEQRVSSEGVSFLTKSLPRLAKAFDKALCSGHFDFTGFQKDPVTKLPKFLGSFFVRVFGKDGMVLPNPCTDAIQGIRQVLYLVYKLELPYEPEQEATVCANFVSNDAWLPDPSAECWLPERSGGQHVARVARSLLHKVMGNFDPRSADVVPRHGPGSVATGEQSWEKMHFKRIYSAIDAFYPYTEYYYSGMTQLCDELDALQSMEVIPSGTAKVVLVPKDSRGPRLISCEPLEYQWIQQGLGRAVMRHVESHPLTKGVVNFTDQTKNRDAALHSSLSGERATIDMKDASDLVSMSLVRALFPQHLVEALEAVRTTATTMPSGVVVTLKKHAPMGSCLCFPIEALCFWALLVADRVVRLGEKPSQASAKVLVFGDDIVVPSRDAEDAIETLEMFYLKVNRSKCCIQGFFRESCGVDAYKGIDVTPLRLKKVWRRRRDPSVFTAYVDYANSLWQRGYRTTAGLLAQWLGESYGPIPRCNIGDRTSVPSFCFDPIGIPEPRTRFRKESTCGAGKPWYSVMEHYVWYSSCSTQKVEPDRWSELFRCLITRSDEIRAGSYTIPRRSVLRRGWRMR